MVNHGKFFGTACCLWPIPELSVTHSSTVAELSLDYPLTISRLSLDCIWTIHGLSLNLPWTVPSPSVANPQTIPERSLDDSWTIPGPSLNYPWTISEPSLDCFFTVYGQSLDYPWTVPRLSLDRHWSMLQGFCDLLWLIGMVSNQSITTMSQHCCATGVKKTCSARLYLSYRSSLIILNKKSIYLSICSRLLRIHPFCLSGILTFSPPSYCCMEVYAYKNPGQSEVGSSLSFSLIGLDQSWANMSVVEPMDTFRVTEKVFFYTPDSWAHWFDLFWLHLCQGSIVCVTKLVPGAQTGFGCLTSC